MNKPFEFLVDELLPHSDPMILIDRIISCDENAIESEVVISEDKLFLNENLNMPAWVGIEYMAQTVAAFIGYQSKKKSGPVKIGFLLGTRKFHAHEAYFKKKHVYRVEASHLFNDEGLGAFDCKICDLENKFVYCEAKINAYQPDDIDAYLATLEDNHNES